MWCHLLLVLPVVGLALFLFLPWPLALAGTTVLGLIALGIAVPSMRALRRPILTGREALVGRVAEAASEIEREGLVRYGSELWTAVTSRGPIPKDTRVEIEDVKGAKLVVRPVALSGPAPGAGAAQPGRRRDREEAGA